MNEDSPEVPWPMKMPPINEQHKLVMPLCPVRPLLLSHMMRVSSHACDTSQEMSVSKTSRVSNSLFSETE